MPPKAILILLVVAFGTLPGAFLSGAEHPLAASTFRLPLEVFDGYLFVVEGSVGARHGLKFLLDTGATHTTVDRKLIQGAKHEIQKVKIVSGGSVIAVDQTRLPQLSLGALDARDLNVTVADLSYLRGNGVSIDAIIGLDLLSPQTLFLDIAHKQAVFGADIQLRHHVPLHADVFSFQVPVEIDTHTVWMIADTGTPTPLFFVERLGNLNIACHMAGHIVGTTVAGALDSRIAFVPRIQIAGQALDRRVYLIATPNSKVFENTAGYLSIASLHASQILFDFRKGELRWSN